MKRIKLSAITIIAAIFSGCATNVAKLPITARDHQTYTNKYTKEYSIADKNSALCIAIVPQDPSLQGKDKRNLATLKSLTNTFGDSLETALSGLSSFKVVPRSEISAIQFDKNLINKSEKYKIKNVNHMLIYRISNYNFKQFTPLFGDKNPKPRFNAYIKVKVSLINIKENVKEFTETISGESGSSAPSENIGLLNQAIENVVNDFSIQLAVKYAPIAIVQLTKGSGQVALLNIGKNFALMKNMKIEFFFFKEKGGKRRVVPFAYGKVIEITDDSAWVDIDNFEEAGVKENHFARVRKDQAKSFFESLPVNNWKERQAKVKRQAISGLL